MNDFQGSCVEPAMLGHQGQNGQDQMSSSIDLVINDGNDGRGCVNLVDT